MVSRTSRACGLVLCLFTAGAVMAAGCTGSKADNGNGSGGSSASGGASGSGGAMNNGGSGGRSGSGGTGSGGSGSGGSVVDAPKEMGGSGGAPGPDLRPETAGGSGGNGGMTAQGCDAPGLVWKTAAKTNYESYPAPGSEECIVYSGCDYLGQFAACSQVRSKAWVMSHNIVSVFPDFNRLKLHDLCLKSGNKTIVVTVIDACGDSDCDGCCTENKGNAEELIDLETFTNARFGVDDGRIQWADLGPTKGGGCN